ncbi:DUF523 domain-containing protein [Staphylococcus americanisciuri]|uniref:DUF523 domain-containing protein n=1 Tax=Staphylococcus americanisciuri TaxID=2973940 RepID=A0ABT2EZX2_9STAP|nr:DUF523 domain-containing protein [Staphylococcus americanisciuri]MCS4485750.1 DUF523 domain-containing protein [Staphylococcus americanisciuri]
MIGISACLIGQAVRYDGGHKQQAALKRLIDRGEAIAICPEVLGGLSVPREPSELIKGDGMSVWSGQNEVQTQLGTDVTQAFKQGAQEALHILQQYNIDTVILKDGSPSCGSAKIYNGQFNGTQIQGVGVTTALLQQHGIRVYNEYNWQTIYE